MGKFYKVRACPAEFVMDSFTDITLKDPETGKLKFYDHIQILDYSVFYEEGHFFEIFYYIKAEVPDTDSHIFRDKMSLRSHLKKMGVTYRV
jgi:hypothetical protein